MQTHLQLTVAFVRLAINKSIDYLFAMVPLLSSAFSATKVVLNAYWEVVWHVLCPVVYCLAHIYVICITLFKKVVLQAAMFVILQPRHIIAAEVSVLISLLCFVFILRQLRRLQKRFVITFSKAVCSLSARCNTIRRRVNGRSKVAAKFLPHALYLLVVSTLHFLIIVKSGGRIGLAVCWNSFLVSNRSLRTVGLVLAGVLFPVIKSVNLLHSMKTAKHVRGTGDIHSKLKYEENNSFVNTLLSTEVLPSSSINNTTTTAIPIIMLSMFFNRILSMTAVLFQTNVWRQRERYRRNEHGKCDVLSETSNDSTSTVDVRLQAKSLIALSNSLLSLLGSTFSVVHSFATLATVKILNDKAGSQDMKGGASEMPFHNNKDLVIDEKKEALLCHNKLNVGKNQNDLNCASGTTLQNGNKNVHSGGAEKCSVPTNGNIPSPSLSFLVP